MSTDPSPSWPITQQQQQQPRPQHCLLPDASPRLEKDNRVAVWRLPSDISQSRLGGRTSPSNACTLIALQLIELFERRNLHFVTPTQSRAACASLRVTRAPAGAESNGSPALSSVRTGYLVGTFVEAMVDGNEAHELALRKRKAGEQNFTIPDAIAAFDKRFTEIDFCSVSGSFTQQLPRFIRIALRSPSLLPLIRLHFVIIAFERTVLLVADRRTSSLLLLDSHLHGSVCGPTTGAILASAHFSELSLLVQWMSEYIFPETHSSSNVQEFEISTVVYAAGGADAECAAVTPSATSGSGFTRGGRLRAAPAAQLQLSQPPYLMRPTSIFMNPQDKENVQAGACSGNVFVQPMQQQQPLHPLQQLYLQQTKKPAKRTADSTVCPARDCDSSEGKRVCPGPASMSVSASSSEDTVA